MKENKRFVLIVPLYSSFKIFFEDLCLEMVKKNWEVTVITNLPSDFNSQETRISCEHLEIPRKLQILNYIKASRQLKKIINDLSPTLIHAHFQAAALVTRLCSFKNIKLQTTSHGLIYNIKKSWISRYLFKHIELFIYKRFDTVWVLNKLDYDALNKKISNVRLYPTKGLGCNIEDFEPNNFTAKADTALKDIHRINHTDFLLIFVGRLTNFKGFDIAVRSFFLLKKKYKNIKFLVLGDLDPIHPSGLTENELDQYNNDCSILKLGFSNEVNKFLSIADLLVFPSVKEGMPVNLMEAISMGVPFITLNSRGCADIADNQKYGSILEHQSVADLLLEIEKLYLNPKLLDEIRERQLSDRELFDRKHFIKYQIDDYEQEILIV
ncbi:glycosyltransferase [Bacteroidia bacterium]|nr:glycosyltransferase [Bacteroidia bacterium]